MFKRNPDGSVTLHLGDVHLSPKEILALKYHLRISADPAGGDPDYATYPVIMNFLLANLVQGIDDKIKESVREYEDRLELLLGNVRKVFPNVNNNKEEK